MAPTAFTLPAHCGDEPVKSTLARSPPDCDFDARECVAVLGDAVVVEEIFGGVGAGWHCAHCGAHHLGGIVEQVAGRRR